MCVGVHACVCVRVLVFTSTLVRICSLQVSEQTMVMCSHLHPLQAVCSLQASEKLQASKQTMVMCSHLLPCQAVCSLQASEKLQASE